MKFFFTFSILIIAIQGFSQDYQSFIEKNDSLIMLIEDPSEGTNQTITINGDTIVNGLIYSKLNFNRCNSALFSELICSPYFEDLYGTECLIFPHYDLLIREDATNSKLFIYSKKSNIDYLIMDLNLKKGDVFEIIKNGDENLSFKVDSVFFENDRKTIQFENQLEFGVGKIMNTKLKFIEGIGPNWGLFYAFNHYDNLLLCSYKKNILNYHNSLDFDCSAHWRLTGIREINYENQISISQKLSDIKIHLETEDKFDFKVYNISGKLILSKSGNYKNACFQLNRDNFYIIRVSYANKLYTQKIIYSEN